jgi:hypothetical protein
MNLNFQIKNNKFIYVQDGSGKIMINFNAISIPFGLEKYNNKDIVNIEFLVDSDNLYYNYVSLLESIEKKVTDSNIDMLKNKKFIPSIKKGKIGYLLRTHLNPKPNIFIKTKINTVYNVISSSLKNTTSNIQVYLKGIWVTEDTYGLYWDLKECEIIKIH